MRNLLYFKPLLLKIEQITVIINNSKNKNSRLINIYYYCLSNVFKPLLNKSQQIIMYFTKMTVFIFYYLFIV